MEEVVTEKIEVEASGGEATHIDEEDSGEAEESTPAPSITSSPPEIHTTTPEPVTTGSTRSSLISTTESTTTTGSTSTSSTTTTRPQKSGRPNGRVNNVVPSFDFEDVS